MMNETKKTRFFFKLKEFGFCNFFCSTDFVISLTFFIFIITDKYFGLGMFNCDENFLVAIFAAASTLFAITLASLAIILSFSTSEFVKFLKQKNKFSPMLFIFWVGNGAYLVVVILTLFYYMFVNFQLLTSILYPIIISVFVYAIISTFYLLALVIRFGYFLDIYESNSQNRS